MRWALLLVALAVGLAGCAKFNTYYNAKRAFDDAERVRDEAIRRNEDPPPPVGNQKQSYDLAIQKAQKILDDYPGHSLTDDALFLQAKSWHRLESYRMSVRKLDLLFQNFPATEYLEEALYLQGLNYLLIGAAERSQDFLERLQRKFPDSEYRAEVLKVSGDNAYALEDWEVAATAYQGYLDQESDIKERDRIGLKLAECHWELEDYYAAAAALQDVSQSATSRDLRFRARLLQARVHVRIGDFEVAELLLRELRNEAEVYNVRGQVLLIEAESLIAQGRGDEATPLLESMPTEWETPAVRARARDLLGYLYLGRDDWERANLMFQEAMRRRQDLDDPERTRLYSDSLRDYLAAEQRLVDAREADVPRYKLLQANALLFGFSRPRLATNLYQEVAADAAADSTIAARALYGAYVVHADHLDLPDSADIFATDLEARYPDSPQAHEVRSAGGSDLLGYLLARRSEEQAAAYAAMDDSTRAALLAGVGGPTTGLRPGRGQSTRLRRQMVYLQRRDNVVFEPTQAQLDLAAQRQAGLRRDAQRQAGTDSLRATAADTTGSGTGGAAVVPFAGGAEPTPEVGGAAQTGPVPVDPATAAAGAAAGQEDAAATDEPAEGEGEGEEDEEQAAEEKKDEEFDLW